MNTWSAVKIHAKHVKHIAAINRRQKKTGWLPATRWCQLTVTISEMRLECRERVHSFRRKCKSKEMQLAG